METTNSKEKIYLKSEKKNILWLKRLKTQGFGYQSIAFNK